MVLRNIALLVDVRFETKIVTYDNIILIMVAYYCHYDMVLLSLTLQLASNRI